MANIFQTIANAAKGFVSEPFTRTVIPQTNKAFEETAAGFPTVQSAIEKRLPKKPAPFTPQEAQNFQQKNIFQQLADAQVRQRAVRASVDLPLGAAKMVLGTPRDIARGLVGVSQEYEGFVSGKKPEAYQPKNIFERLAFGNDPVQSSRVRGQDTVEMLPGFERPGEGVGLGVGLALAGLDFLPGGKKATEAVIVGLNKADDAVRVAKQMGIADDLVDLASDLFVRAKTPQQAQKAIDYLESLQKTTKATPVPAPKQIDNLTKDEMIEAIDYIRLKKPFNQVMEEKIGLLVQKYGVKAKTLPKVADEFQDLVEKTKTLDRTPRQLLHPISKSENVIDLRGNVAKPISPDLQPLAKEARKYKSAEEFAKEKVVLESLIPQDRQVGTTLSEIKFTGKTAKTQLTSATPLEKSLKEAIEIEARGGDKLVGNYAIEQIQKATKGGRVKVFHGTTEEAAQKIGNSFDNLAEGAYLSLTKGVGREALGVRGAGFYAEQATKAGKNGVVVELDIPVSKLAVDDVTGELRFTGKKSQLTDFYNQAVGTPRFTKGAGGRFTGSTAIPRDTFEGFKDLTAKFLDYAKGKTTLSKQEITDFARRPELKKGEADLLTRKAQELTEARVPAREFADSMRRDLLELKPVKVKEPQYDRIRLGFREGQATGKNYEEVVFESPITTNGSSHFPNSKNYFAHARGDEVVESGKKIWREQEIQSDLLQKESLDRLAVNNLRSGDKIRVNNGEPSEVFKFNNTFTVDDIDFTANDVALGKVNVQLVDSKYTNKLQPFTNDRFGERIMRERIKEKASKGYSKYRLPTGETIGKIEGFEANQFFTATDKAGLEGMFDIPLKPETMKVGTEVFGQGQNWIITDILGDGRFKAVPKASYENIKSTAKSLENNSALESAKETFDLTGKSNPQYSRYDKWGKFLKNKYGGKEVTDPQGNSWVEIDLTRALANSPVEAFGAVAGIERDEEGNISFDPQKAALGALGIAGIRKMGGKITGKSPETAKQISQKTPQTLGRAIPQRLSDRGVSLPQGIPQAGINLNRFQVPKTAIQKGEQLIDDMRPIVEEKIGKTLSHEEVKEYAKSTGQVLKRAVGREDTVKWEAALKTTSDRLAKSLQSGKLTKDSLQDFMAIKTAGTDVARKLESFKIAANPEDASLANDILSEVYKYNQNVDDILKAAEGVNFNNAKEAAQFYRTFIKPKMADWVDLVRYNSMLSSPTTHAVNIFSNLVNSLLVAPTEYTLRGAIDIVGSRLTGRQQRYLAREGLSYSKGYVQNVGKAFRDFTDVMRGKQGIEHLDVRFVPLAPKGGAAGKVESALSVPTKLLEGMDRFFMALAEGGERAALQARQAKGIGVRNLDVTASEAARYRIFRQDLSPANEGVLLNSIDEMTKLIERARHSKNPIVSTIAKFTIPFLRTPMNIFKQGIEYSPIGFGTLPKATNKTEQLTKAIMGTSVALGASTMLGSGRLTWAEPTSKTEKSEWRAAGRQPYSIKIGNKWYSYQKLPPVLAFPMAMVSSIDDSIKEAKITDSQADLILSGLAKNFQFFADQSYMRSIGDLIAIKSEYGLEKLISNYPTQLIPYRALSGWFARLIEESEKTIDAEGFIDKQIQLLMLQIPGLRNLTPDRLGPTGQPIEIPVQERLLNAFSPVRLKEENERFAEFLEAKDMLRAAEKARKELKGLEGDTTLPKPPIEGQLEDIQKQTKEIQIKTKIENDEQYRSRLEDIYNSIQSIKGSGGWTDAEKARAQRALDSLSAEEYEEYVAYKEWITAEKSSNTRTLKAFLKSDPKKAVEYLKSLEREEAQRILDGLTDEEYQIYQSGK